MSSPWDRNGAVGGLDLEDTLDRFEAAWRGEAPPEIQEFLPPAEAQGSTAIGDLACELVEIDLWHRWRQAGRKDGSQTISQNARGDAVRQVPDRPLLEDYVALYPALGGLEELPLDLIAEEYRARHRYGDRPSAADYLGRFPQRAQELQARLALLDQELSSTDSSRLIDTRVNLRPGQKTDAVPEPAERDATPERIGKYHVVGRLDEGGQAVVYRVVHPTLAKELVLKLSRLPQYSPSETERLTDEGRILAELDHPHLARVHDLDFHEGRPYLVMEYVRGLNLRQYQTQHVLNHQQIARLVAQVARGLAAAHEKGVIHQDLKPQNIVVDDAGNAKIIDFGLARLCHAWSHDSLPAGMVCGTAQYMSPEQARGENDQIDHRTDIFSLGAVLFALLTGKAPFAGSDVYDSLQRAAECQFDPQLLQQRAVPPALAAICRTALQSDPDQRYRSAIEMAEDLEKYAARRRPRPLMWAGLASVLCLVAAAAALWWWAGQHPTRGLRQDFPLYVALGDAGEDVQRLVVREGQQFALQVRAGRDCYLGVWLIDAEGQASLVFPQRPDDDHFLPAGQTRSLPAFRATPSAGPEFLHLAASSQPWPAAAGRQRGPAVVDASAEELARWQPLTRGVERADSDRPAVAERKIPLEVRSDR